MNPSITGLHHVTAITSDPQRTLDFYVGLLGLRFVKRTVNFDDPTSYHFYFGDARGTPEPILTFFAWPGKCRTMSRSALGVPNVEIGPATNFWTFEKFAGTRGSKEPQLHSDERTL